MEAIMDKRWIAGLFAAAVFSSAAYGQVNLSFGIEIAPPPPRVEIVPPSRPDFVWTPGYWAWDHGRHVWIEGRWIAARRGEMWVPERWVEFREQRGVHWHFEPGHWERVHRHDYDRGRDHDYR
jgi:hypothetical protein